jgi:DNA-binding transcriptional LysR family regulator
MSNLDAASSCGTCQTLMTVIEAGGMRKAADRLNYSQPAVSKAIASLERTLGKRLLERSRRGIELTPYGEAVIKCGVAVFDALRKGVADIDFLSDPTAGEVRIGCTEPVSAGIVSAVMDRLVRRYPRIMFRVLLRDSLTLHRELTARNVDILIAQMERPINEENMQSEILYHESKLS